MNCCSLWSLLTPKMRSIKIESPNFNNHSISLNIKISRSPNWTIRSLSSKTPNLNTNIISNCSLSPSKNSRKKSMNTPNWSWNKVESLKCSLINFSHIKNNSNRVRSIWSKNLKDSAVCFSKINKKKWFSWISLKLIRIF